MQRMAKGRSTTTAQLAAGICPLAAAVGARGLGLAGMGNGRAQLLVGACLLSPNHSTPAPTPPVVGDPCGCSGGPTPAGSRTAHVLSHSLVRARLDAWHTWSVAWPWAWQPAVFFFLFSGGGRRPQALLGWAGRSVAEQRPLVLVRLVGLEASSVLHLDSRNATRLGPAAALLQAAAPRVCD